MQKIDIQLPPDDPIDLWDLTRLIAKSICPSLREAEDHAWLQKKLVKLPASDLEIQSDMTTAERTALLRILPGLPTHAGMSAKDRAVFMDAYLKHPDRLAWKPVFVSEEEIAANSHQILQIQEKHRLALQQEIASGKLIAFNHHHISESHAGKNIFVRREDALRYLQQQRLRIAEGSSFKADEPSSKSAAQYRDKAGTSGSGLNGDTEAKQAATEAAINNKTRPLQKSRAEQPRSPGLDDIDDQIAQSSDHSAASLRHRKADQLNSRVPPQASSLPNPAPLVILRRKQVEERTSLSRSAIYDRLDPNSPRHDPSFPKQIKLSASASGWVESEIEAWLKARLEARSKQTR